MRFLDVLARRVEDLPVVLVVAARPAEPGAEQDILDALAAAPAARTVHAGSSARTGCGRCWSAPSAGVPSPRSSMPASR
jgi:hypothetical protein